MQPLLGNRVRPATIALTLCALTPWGLAACRSTLVSAPPISGAQSGIQKTEGAKAEVPTEVAKLPETDALNAPSRRRKQSPGCCSNHKSARREKTWHRAEWNTIP